MNYPAGSLPVAPTFVSGVGYPGAELRGILFDQSLPTMV